MTHDETTDGMCKDCGVNHKEQLIANLPELALYNFLDEWCREHHDEEFDLFSTGLKIWTHSFVYGNQNEYMMQQQVAGVPVHQAVSNFAELMMQVAFVVGVHAAEEYRDRIGLTKVTAPEEKISEYIEHQKKLIEERGSDHAPDPNDVLSAVRKSLENLGMDVEVVQIGDDGDGPQIIGLRDKSDQKGDDRPGMYL